MNKPKREEEKLKKRQHANEQFQQMLMRNGGTLSANDVAEMLGCSTLRVEDMVIDKKLIAFKTGSEYQIPAFQIHKGQVLAHLSELARALSEKGASPVVMCDFFINGGVTDAQNTISILQALRLGASEQQLFYIQREANMLFEMGR
ncbi:hypothetical protein YA0089_27145 [Pseudomonas viridiflava]|uniref:hypothetical protein n=1 Tax=Pseudomonas viridiflava TaxID=33069 RepID=UPI0018E62539|nr:hypothetical protein [Pseudomonas viridiflava]MBI6727295.1 hypothetical protein [Pseudomonas viridiflava]